MKKLATKLVIAAVILGVTTIRGGEAEEALNKMRTAWGSVSTYTVMLTSYQEKGDKSLQSTIELGYKNPGWMKVKVVDGHEKGSRAVYDPVKDRMQATFAGVALPVFFSPDARMAQSVRGEKIYVATFKHLLKKADWYLANGSLSWVGTDTYDGAECSVIEFKTSSPEANLGIARERWWLDKETGFPRKIYEYDSEGKRVKWNVYKNLVLNPSLPDDYFKF
ncbi:outer membrane lipoprotein carrier protein LolA [candidate division WOR-3 bacterium]|nr:outer membrane lipoprotein carrier protein LolA [candidate division WOR-3 bacterium]